LLKEDIMKPHMTAFIIGLFLFYSCSVAQTDSAAGEAAMPVKVLIAKGNSYLENAVAAMINDSLTAQGRQVTIIDLKKINNQNRGEFKVVVLFNAIKASTIGPTVSKFVRSTEDYGSGSNLLICNVYGDKWENKPSDVSAVTSATKTLKPGLVASKVLANIYLMLHE
jgi:hypothetical protein